MIYEYVCGGLAMTYVSFRGGETAGSVGKRNINHVSFYGGETAGSVGKRNLEPEIQITTPEKDTVNFKGRNYDEGSSTGSTILGFIGAAALIVGGLGYAHKTGLTGKIKNVKIQEYAEKIAEPCYNLCSKIKSFFKK